MKKENLFTKSGVKSKKAKANYFTGTVSAKDISATIKPTNEKIYHVTFKNGSKTKLHFHNGGQTLKVTKGRGSLVKYRKIGTGIKNFKIADPIHHEDLFKIAGENIKNIELNTNNFRKVSNYIIKNIFSSL